MQVGAFCFDIAHVKVGSLFLTWWHSGFLKSSILVTIIGCCEFSFTEILNSWFGTRTSKNKFTEFKQKLWPMHQLLHLQCKVLRDGRPRQIYFHRISYDELWFLEHMSWFQDSTIARCYRDLKNGKKVVRFTSKHRMIT